MVHFVYELTVTAEYIRGAAKEVSSTLQTATAALELTNPELSLQERAVTHFLNTLEGAKLPAEILDPALDELGLWIEGNRLVYAQQIPLRLYTEERDNILNFRGTFQGPQGLSDRRCNIRVSQRLEPTVDRRSSDGSMIRPPHLTVTVIPYPQTEGGTTSFITSRWWAFGEGRLGWRSDMRSCLYDHGAKWNQLSYFSKAFLSAMEALNYKVFGPEVYFSIDDTQQDPNRTLEKFQNFNRVISGKLRAAVH